MALYLNGKQNHQGSVYTFSVFNHKAIGDVASEHAGWEILFADTGSAQGMELGLKGQRYDLSKVPGLIYNARDVHHEYYNKANLHVKALVIPEALIDRQLRRENIALDFDFTKPILNSNDFLSYAKNIHLLLREESHSSRELEALASALVFAIIDHVPHNQQEIRKGLSDSSLNRLLFKDILMSLHRSIGDAAYNLETLSEELGVTPFHLIRTTKRIAGFTPFAYLSNLRLQKAKQDLQKTTEAISKIAFRYGYEEMSTFNKAFKRKYGFSAQQFRT